MRDETGVDKNEQQAQQASYRENFIPYAIYHNNGTATMQWGVFDAKSSQEHDGTHLFADAVSAEITSTGKPIDKVRLRKLAIAYDAELKFGSEALPNKAVDLLQTRLGTKIDASAFLKKHGFESNDLLGFTFNIRQTEYEHKIRPDTKHFGEVEKPKDDDKLGHVPLELHEFDNWSDTQAQNLLYSALIHRYKQVDDNLKGTIKEGISSAFAVKKTILTALGDPGHSAMNITLFVSSAACSAISMGVMSKAALTAQREFNEIFKTYCEYMSNMERKDIHAREANKILKKQMYHSGITYEGTPLVEHGVYKKEYKDFFIKRGHREGLIPVHNTDKTPQEPQTKLNELSQSLRNRTPLAVKTPIHVTKKAARLLYTSVKEIFTDLNVFNKETRANTIGALGSAFGVIASDSVGSVKSLFKSNTSKEEREAYHQHKTEVVNIHQSYPEIVEQQINMDQIAAYEQVYEEIQGVRQNKTVNGANFGLASGANSTQIAELFIHAANQDWMNAAECLYGTITGYGAWGQAGKNFVQDDKNLHGKRSIEVANRPDLDAETLSRIHENVDAEKSRNPYEDHTPS